MDEKKARELLKISSLIAKHNQGTISTSEASELQNWLSEKENNIRFLSEIQNKEQQLKALKQFAEYDTEAALNSALRRSSARSGLKPGTWLRGIAAAIALIAVTGTTLWYLTHNHSMDEEIVKNNIVPARNAATLTIGNGSKIILNNLRDTVARNQNLHIRKTGDGTVLFESVARSQKKPSEVAWNTISTPTGGKFQILLSDGTKAWLNAASYIRFPSEFSEGKREVETGGEVYFEVSKGKIPFVVRTKDQTIEVLGTRFNVNAYKDEAAVKTVLLEGKVRVVGDESVTLSPGQQSINKNGEIYKAPANTETAVAWKNGLFQFNQEPIESIMRQIARWYDVDIEYDEDPGRQRFSGTVSRLGSVADVLRIMEETGVVHFKVKGRRIIVSK